jgi:hypothetical protein
MVTVMRQRSFYRPNGSAEAVKKAKGCFGIKMAVFEDIRPYKAVSDGRTPRSPSMKDIYKGLAMNYRPHPKKRAAVRKLRRKLAMMKMPMPAAYKPVSRVRRARWPSEQNPAPRYRYDGSVKQ